MRRQAVLHRAMEQELALAVTWSLISRSRSRNRSANSSRFSVVSSGMPVVPVQRVSVPDDPAVVALAGRIVELVLLGADDDVVARPLAEIDARLGDLGAPSVETGGRLPDEQPRLALAADLVDRDHRGADPVRVDDPLVDPAGRARVLLERELTRREHDLALDAVDHVAVGVDVGEVVVAADRLELVERRRAAGGSPTAGRW